MSSPSEIQSRYGNTSPLGPYALYSGSAIIDDDVTKELDFDPATDQRRDHYIGLIHELRFYGNKKHSRKSKVTEWETLCQSWGAFVDNFNRDPAGYRERALLEAALDFAAARWCSRGGNSVRSAGWRCVQSLPSWGCAAFRTGP
ncbi:hypothetical protein PR001_g20897 [Phytophthora rubi]|uniref:Uncharacterized protein n=1 Tax=Phytophthora rubi TaxID=129364 RepID=A0A6A3JJE3_9STRA|nr:hypothetical protein PR001_g20897 [Phytophthora rubi]